MCVPPRCEVGPGQGDRLLRNPRRSGLPFTTLSRPYFPSPLLGSERKSEEEHSGRGGGVYFFL